MVNLVNFYGLNCYYDAVMSAADTLGVDYTAAFHNLWAETRFRYDPFRKRFVSRFMMDSLDTLGCHLEKLECKGPPDVERHFSYMDEGDLLVVGMDAYYVPWNPYFGIFFGPHYFVVEYSRGGIMRAYDPTYGFADETIPRGLLVERSCHVNIMRPRERGTLAIDTTAAIAEAAAAIPGSLARLMEWLDRVEAGGQKGAGQAARYVECMVSNRKLFRLYLERREPGVLAALPVLDDGLFKRWAAIKNGLNKAAVVRRNPRLMGEIRGCLAEVMAREAEAAKGYRQG
jgi:hypothetical protein